MARAEKRALNISAGLEETIVKELRDINKQVSKTAKALSKANKMSAASFRTVKLAVAGIGTALIALRGIRAFDGLVQATDQIGKLAIASGVSTEEISELAFAFGAAGGNAEQFRSVLSSLLSSQRGALDGSKQQVEAFRRFGLTIENLRNLNPQQLLEALADGMGMIEDSTEQTLTLATIFPEQWRNVLNLIRGGGDEFRSQLEEARRSGATVTREQAENAARIVDAQQRVSEAVAMVGRVLIEAFGPALTNLFNGIARAITNNKDAIILVARTALTALAKLASSVIDVAVTVASIPEGVGRTVDQLVEGLTFGFIPAAERSNAETAALLEKFEKKSIMLNSLRRRAREAAAGELKSTEHQTERRLRMIAREEEALRQLKKQIDDTLPLSAKIMQAKATFNQFVTDFLTEAQTGDQVLAGIGEVMGADLGKGMADGVSAQIGDIAAKIRAGVSAGTAGEGESQTAPMTTMFAIDFDQVKAGYEQGISQLTTQIENFSNTVGNLLGSGVVSATNALANAFTSIIDGTKKSKDAFKDFGVAVLRIIAQIIAKMAALKIAQTVVGMETGGVLPGVSDDNASLPVQNYAKGGVARSPQLAVFGEGQQAEAFVPLPDNRSIPVTLNGGSGYGGGNMVNLNVYAWDSKDAARGLIENRRVLQSIFTNQADNMVSMRQTIQKASR